MEPLAEGVWHVHVPGRTLPPYEGTECYWIGTPAEAWLVDCGDGSPPAQAALRTSWDALGQPPLARVLLTHRHPDHAGGATWAQGVWAAPVYVHPADAAAVRGRHPDLRVTEWPGGAATVGDVPVDVFHAPGHSPGQLNVWLPRQRVLLAGDNVLGRSTVIVSPPDGDLLAYLRTLDRLLALDPAVIGPGHGEPLRNGSTQLHAYRRHRAERERQVVQLLRAGPRTARDLAEIIYRGVLGPAQMTLGERMTSGQLEALVSLGQAVALPDGRYALA